MVIEHTHCGRRILMKLLACLLLSTFVTSFALSSVQAEDTLSPRLQQFYISSLGHQDANIREHAQAILLRNAEETMRPLAQELASSRDPKQAVAAAVVLANMAKVQRNENDVVDLNPLAPMLNAILSAPGIEPWRFYAAAFAASMTAPANSEERNGDWYALQQTLRQGLHSHSPMKRYASIQAAHHLKDAESVGSLLSLLRQGHATPRGVDMTVLTSHYGDLGYTNSIGAFAHPEAKYDPDSDEVDTRKRFLYFDWAKYGPSTIYTPSYLKSDEATTNTPQGRALFSRQEFLIIAALQELGVSNYELENELRRLASSENIWVKRDAARVWLALRATGPVHDAELSRLLVRLVDHSDRDTKLFAVQQIQALDAIDEYQTPAVLRKLSAESDFDLRHETAVAILKHHNAIPDAQQIVGDILLIQQMAQRGLVRRVGGRVGRTAIRMISAVEELSDAYEDAFGEAPTLPK